MSPFNLQLSSAFAPIKFSRPALRGNFHMSRATSPLSTQPKWSTKTSSTVPSCKFSHCGPTFSQSGRLQTNGQEKCGENVLSHFWTARSHSIACRSSTPPGCQVEFGAFFAPLPRSSLQKKSGENVLSHFWTARSHSIACRSSTPPGCQVEFGAFFAPLPRSSLKKKSLILLDTPGKEEWAPTGIPT